MPIYRVDHKMWTVADVDESITIEGFTMSAVQSPRTDEPESWIAREEVDAVDFLSAYNASRLRLVRTVDALCAVTQCSFSLAAASFSVYRLTDNPGHVIYFRHLRSRRTVGIVVWRPEQLDDISRLMSFERPGALHYFREAINASTASARLAMLVIAAEALAGQSTVIGKCANCNIEYTRGGTNREELERVLGTEAYTQLYKRNNGSLRNRLLHGSTIDENTAAEVSELAYHAILNYLKARLGLGSVERITAAPRTFQSFEWFGTFLRCRSHIAPDLPELERNWETLGELIAQPTGY